MTKIYFRYLFFRLLVPFSVCLFGGTVIWIMADLYGNIYDFLEHKAGFGLVCWFYLLQIPSMLVQVLPAAMLFSALWTLLAMSRRCELVAFQSGGMTPMRLFSPFFVFAAVWVIIYGIDLYAPAPESTAARDRILQKVKGNDSKSNVFKDLVYVDKVNRRVWFFQKLDVGRSKAEGVEILLRDAQNHDLQKYFAQTAQYSDGYWKLSNVREFIYGSDVVVKDYPEMDMTDITTPPLQLSLILSQHEQMTIPQLDQYISTSTSSQELLAGYRTEWWYRVLQPFSLVVLLLFALLNGTHSNRRGAAGGVAWCIVVLLLYTFLSAIFMAFGQHNRMPPFLSVLIMQLVFGAIGLHLLAVKFGWYWQVGEIWKRFQVRSAAKDAAA